MMTLIVGGSGSGKSAYAEDCIDRLSQGCRKYYLATMQVYDKEGQAKIERHRRLRQGKGFVTIEQPVNIQDALLKMDDVGNGAKQNKAKQNKDKQNEAKQDGVMQNSVMQNGVLQSECPAGRTALLECMSNLAANEMFSGEKPRSCEEVTEKVMQGIVLLNRELKHLVIVTNNVFEDGIIYDETTMEYIQALGRLNEKLAAMADQVVEVIVGIPVVVKTALSAETIPSADASSSAETPLPAAKGGQ